MKALPPFAIDRCQLLIGQSQRQLWKTGALSKIRLCCRVRAAYSPATSLARCRFVIVPTLPRVISRETSGSWEWFTRGKPPYEITGKYLFFSTNRERLVEIATDELQNGGFHWAKIPIEGGNLSPEYVLCLYYSDAGRKFELAAKYHKESGLKYRYWKSDQATRSGEYSEEFMSQLPENLRLRFTKKK